MPSIQPRGTGQCKELNEHVGARPLPNQFRGIRLCDTSRKAPLTPTNDAGQTLPQSQIPAHISETGGQDPRYLLTTNSLLHKSKSRGIQPNITPWHPKSSNIVLGIQNLCLFIKRSRHIFLNYRKIKALQILRGPTEIFPMVITSWLQCYKVVRIKKKQQNVPFLGIYYLL